MSLTSLFHSVTGFFKSDKAKHAFDQVSKIIPVALPIVQQIAAATPNRTDDEIIAAFKEYGVPALAGASIDPGAALLTLATTVVARAVPDGTAKSLVQTAIQIAVTGLKAEAA